MDAPDPQTLEGFVAIARAAVEHEADENAENRWWVMAPTIVVQRRDLSVEFLEVTPASARGDLGRALVAAEARAILRALGARRCAIALHVDLEVDGEIFAAIVIAVLAATASLFQYAAVERTDVGTPRLGTWQPSPAIEPELFAALRRSMLAGG